MSNDTDPPVAVLAWARERMNTDEWPTSLDATDAALAAMGFEIGDSAGRTPGDYATSPDLRARWLLGQLREIAAARPSGLTMIATMNAWDSLAAESTA